MKSAKSRKTVSRFQADTPFDSDEVSGGNPASRVVGLEELKQRLLQDQTRATSDAAMLACLRRAAEEAASLAWATPYPLLVLPELFAEKAAEARFRSQRQREIRERSRDIVEVAA